MSPDPHVPHEEPGFVDLGFARVDVGREARQGLAEVVYGPGKRPEHIAAIVGRLLSANSGPVLVTRVEPDIADRVRAVVSGGRHDPGARLLAWRPAPASGFRLAVVTAGTSDAPVAAEAVAVAAAIGLHAVLHEDIGIAGLHRLLAVRGRLEEADAVIVVAGMEAALASAIGGLVACPVIAVPTSTGYGAAFGGLTALLGMVSSCAAGITVVNIDSGFGAAMAAHRIAQVVRRQG